MNNKNQNEKQFSEDFFKNKDKNNGININNDKIIERPQTARINSGLSNKFKKLYEEIDKLNNENNKNSKNTFEDVLNEETDEDEDDAEAEGEEEGEKEEIKEEKINNKENNNNKDIDNNQIDEGKIEEDISDDEIENMFRKSYQNLEKMREEIKSMNEAMDKKSNIINTNNVMNNTNNKKVGNKQNLKPIVKRDNTNILNNKIFIKQGNKLSGDNKNINENNKNMSQRYQGFAFQLKK